MGWIDKLILKMKGEIGRVSLLTMTNCDRVIAGLKAQREENDFTPALVKQQAYVDASLERCRRCGEPVAFMQMVGLATICPECERYFRDLDGDLIWFVDMIERTENVEGGKPK